MATDPENRYRCVDGNSRNARRTELPLITILLTTLTALLLIG